jgi:hypothetical protein
MSDKIQDRIICLVGSVKQEKDWREWVSKLTARGYVVFEAGLYGTVGNGIDQEIWDKVTFVHQKKIELSDTIGIIKKPDGSIGQHTKEDIDYALGLGKEVVDVRDI